MRTGTNPEKLKYQKILYKLHRVIIPVYIPDEGHKYFKDLDKVFKENINSLIKTIDSNQTNITIINNNSKKEVTDYIDKLLQDKLIDKHIKYSENYGKVYSVLQEARASYEDFITIADADVFFFTNWQNEVHQVFDRFKKVGVVGLTPDPHMAFYCNNSLWFSNFFFIKKGKIVEDYELELFEEGIDNKNFFISRNNNWKEKQYYLEKKGRKVVVGASHFASTYRKSVFKKLKFEKPINVFPGGELTFLDTPIDKMGYHRVSLFRAFAYHMGNTLKQGMNDSILESRKLIFLNTNANVLRYFVIPYNIRKLFVRVILKLVKL